MSYCASRYHPVRRRTTEVMVGGVGVGGTHPVRIQSMTTSDTQDIAATVRQSIALAEVGCEIVRITAPNVAAAKCLKDIRAQFTAAGFGHIPLVADIHFLPAAAMEAVEHVEKVRVNPGNYADKKKFAVKEYTDVDYDRELARLHESFSPLVKRSKELGRAMRIGTNHGSLSDRIMNRFGDTPLGMVESALEFLPQFFLPQQHLVAPHFELLSHLVPFFFPHFLGLLMHLLECFQQIFVFLLELLAERLHLVGQ